MTILVIGGGKMGMSHLALATHYAGKAGVALCDKSRTSRALFSLLGYRTYSSPEAALAKGAIKGMIVATPTAAHKPLASWGIAHGIPVFVEKPLTLNPQQSDALVAEAAAANVPSQTGFVMRYVATFQRLRSLIRDGRLGPLEGYSAEMRGYVVTKPLPDQAWQGDFARGGGCLNEYGPHLIDLCRFVFGPITDVTSAKSGQVHSTKADDNISVDWVHENGAPGGLHLDWADPSKRKSVIEMKARFAHADVRVDNSSLELTWREDTSETLSLTDEARSELEQAVWPANVGFYLRGEEFSLEIEDFLTTCLGGTFHVDPNLPQDITPRLEDGAAVDTLIAQIAQKAGLK